MTRRDTASTLIQLRTLKEHVDAAYQDALRRARDDFDLPGVREIGVLGDEQIGHVLLAKGRETWTVTDPQALLEWVRANVPDEVVIEERVRGSYVSALLARAKSQGNAADAFTGELIPGIECRRSEPRLDVRPSEDAAETIGRVMTEGRLSLTDITTPAIEARP
jgi:hypothetical protein